MSLEKSKHLAQRWLLQAKADLKAARASHFAESFEWACFQAQQSGEKALKALWYATENDPWGHSLLRLIQDHPDDSLRGDMQVILPQARLLDKLYIPTRYPDGLPDLTPSEVFGSYDGEEAILAAERVIGFVESRLS